MRCTLAGYKSETFFSSCVRARTHTQHTRQQHNTRMHNSCAQRQQAVVLRSCRPPRPLTMAGSDSSGQSAPPGPGHGRLRTHHPPSDSINQLLVLPTTTSISAWGSRHTMCMFRRSWAWTAHHVKIQFIIRKEDVVSSRVEGEASC